MSFVIETGNPIPPPNKTEAAIKALKSLKPNQNILCKDNVVSDRTIFYRAAASVGIEIRTQKKDGGGIRIWRVK